MPQLAFTLYELTKEVRGGESPGGKEMANTYAVLQELAKKKFLLSYTEETRKGNEGFSRRKIEEFQSLIRLLKVTDEDLDNDRAPIRQTETILVGLNPIFRHQIDSKFILYPSDITRRTIVAYGSHTIPDSTIRLRDYLLREISGGRFECEINVETLYWTLCDRWMKEKRRKKVVEFVDRAIETVKRLGLLLRHEILTGAAGQPKVVFHINKAWK